MENEELNDLHTLPHTWVIKSRMRSARHEARMGLGEVHARFLSGNMIERDHLEDTGLEGRIRLRGLSRN